MNRLISALKRGSLAGNRDGSTTIEFAMVIPILVMLSLGIVDFSLLMFDFARAAEATRRGARVAAISPPVGNLDNLASGDVRCESTSGTPTCDGASVANAGTFDNVIAEMKSTYSDIGDANVEVTYSASGIGVAEAGGYKPYVEVRLTNFQRPFHALQAVAGTAPSITFPPFATTVLGNSYSPTGP